MKRFFTYIASLFPGNNQKSTKKHKKGGIVETEQFSESENIDSKIVLDSRFEQEKFDSKRVLDSSVESIEQNEPIDGMRIMPFIETPPKSNRVRVIEVIELHKESNPTFTTSMVYKWLGGNMPILSVRKCIYTLHSKGYLTICKKTVGEDKKVKFYSLKN